MCAALQNPEKVVVLDRSIYSDYVFALNGHQGGLISAAEFQEYLKLYHAAVKRFPLPAAMLYLDVSPEECLYRIHEVRARECERGIEIEYINGIDACYR